MTASADSDRYRYDDETRAAFDALKSLPRAKRMLVLVWFCRWCGELYEPGIYQCMNCGESQTAHYEAKEAAPKG